MDCILVNNTYQKASRASFRFVPNKSYGQLMTTILHPLIMLKTVNTEFSFEEVCFTYQDNRALEIEDSINISMIIGMNNL